LLSTFLSPIVSTRMSYLLKIWTGSIKFCGDSKSASCLSALKHLFSTAKDASAFSNASSFAIDAEFGVKSRGDSTLALAL
jgi:hypothetical protein